MKPQDDLPLRAGDEQQRGEARQQRAPAEPLHEGVEPEGRDELAREEDPLRGRHRVTKDQGDDGGECVVGEVNAEEPVPRVPVVAPGGVLAFSEGLGYEPGTREVAVPIDDAREARVEERLKVKRRERDESNWDDPAKLGFAPSSGLVLYSDATHPPFSEPLVNELSIVIADVLTEQALQLPLVERNHLT